MIEFKTKMTTVSVSDTITITRKGKNPLSDKLLWILASAWIVDEDEIFLKVGAYSITIMECVWSEYYSEYILIDDSICCEDCGDSFYNDDMEEGSDGCLYCSGCIHDHLEDEEEIA